MFGPRDTKLKELFVLRLFAVMEEEEDGTGSGGGREEERAGREGG